MPKNEAAIGEASSSLAVGSPLGRPAPNARRRRLLAGAVGLVPSVYTLASGAQVSAASQTVCLARQQTGSNQLGLATTQQATAPSRFASHSDTWFRSTTYSGNYEGRQAHCVTSPQNSCIDPLQPGQGGAGSTWITNGGRLSTYDVRVVVGHGNQVTNVGQQPPMQGLVYVNQNATFATLDPNGRTGLQPAQLSCMTSMIAGRTLNLG